MPATKRRAPMSRLAARGRIVAGALAIAALATLGSPALAATPASAERPASAASPASAARTISLNESAQLRLTSRHGFTLDERGSAAGSVSGPIYVHLTIVSTTRVVAEVNLYPRGGSITGQASATYRRGSSTASFSGTMAIVRGTGTFAHAHGSGLSFSGTIRRSDEAIAVRVHGTASE